MSAPPIIWGIIPAAGIGARMQAERPKQYLALAGQTILAQSITRLMAHDAVTGIMIALAADDADWTALDTTQFSKQILTTTGGATRAASVHCAVNALVALGGDLTNVWVMVHDAARPCLRLADVDALIAAAIKHPVGAVLGLPVNDTVKRTNAAGDIIETVSRENLWRAATPQMFRLLDLQAALVQAEQAGVLVTDDASAMEIVGKPPQMVAGHADNIKITQPQDLVQAALYLRQQQEEATCE